MIPRESFLGTAEDVAQECVKAWTRAVLREVALQSLRARLHFEERQGNDDGASDGGGDDHDDGGRLVVKLSNDAVDSARRLCQAVGMKWAEKIQDNGHFQVGEWIRSVLDAESEVLFYAPPPSESDGSSSASEGTNLRRPVSSSTSAGKTGMQRGEENQNAKWDRGSSSPLVTAASRLQIIGSRCLSDVESEPIDPETAIQLIDNLADRRETDWPYNWTAIQEKCDDIPDRLHNSKRAKTELVLVPKSAWDQHDGDSIGRMSELRDDEAEAFILQRKRKSRHKIEQAKKTHLPTNEGDYRSVALDDSGSTPRPASLVSHVSWSRDDRSLSMADQEYLDEAYIHSAESSAREDGSITILGSLRDAGRFHHFLQGCADRTSSAHAPGSAGGTLREASSGRSAGSRTIRQLKWQKRGSIKERLGDHRLIQQDTREAGQASRILRTVDHHGRRWLDFDLGHCLLDVAEPGHPARRRKMYYFDSLEVALLDEDSLNSGTINATSAT
jgi:hypothetical protein